MSKYLTVFILVISFFENSLANERENKLDHLFDKLKISTKLESLKIESEIWDIWSVHPSKDRKGYRLTEMLSKGELLMNTGRLENALEVFTIIVAADPEWSEGWNKRATVLYLLGNYEDSINDIKKTLILEKRHFGALSGLGLIQIELQNYSLALECYKKAIKIYPTMEAPKKMIPLIEKLIKDKNI